MLRQFNRIWLLPTIGLALSGYGVLGSVYASSKEVSQLNTEDLAWIAQRIYQNEIGGNPDNLVYWSPKEEFPSLGIGHFIWIPQGVEVPFIETFPQMVSYVSRIEPAPEWIQKLHPFKPPWHSKTEFDQDLNSRRMKQLRDWLTQTQHAQAEFIYLSLQKKWQTEIQTLSVENRQKINRIMATMSTDKMGRFALIDYYNFKGLGGNPREKYKGVGWGLLDVLLAMPDKLLAEDMLPSFVSTAKQTLRKRVLFSPPHRNEKQFIPGWDKRLNQYLVP